MATLDWLIILAYLGSVMGGNFTLDGESYSLATNDGDNHLHGGDRGFDKVVWAGEPFQNDTAVGVVFSYTSPDGEEGYPGTLSIDVGGTMLMHNNLTYEWELGPRGACQGVRQPLEGGGVGEG